MIANRVRNIVGFRKRRNRHKGNADPELIEVGTSCRIWTRRVRRKFRAKQYRIFYAGVRRAHRITGAFRATPRLFTCRWIRKVGALPRGNSVRRQSVILRRRRRRCVIVEAAVLIVGEEDYGVLPVRTVANCVDYLRNVGLASLYIRWWMLIVFERRSGQTKIWIDKRDRGQQSQCGLDKKSGKGQEVRVKFHRAEKTEARSLLA